MTRLLLPALITLVLASPQEVSTQYTEGRGLRIEIESTFKMETVQFSIERDGEPLEGGFGGGGSSEETRAVTMIDTVMTAKDGAPDQVRREFESITSSAVTMRRDEEMESERDCPLNGVVIEIQNNKGETTAKVVEGDTPSDEAALEGHSLTLALDALLPEDDVEAGGSYEIKSEALSRALAFDLESALFPRPVREERDAGGGERGGGGRGRRGGTRGGGATAARYFSLGEWDVKATLGEEPQEHEGTMCYLISIEGEASGDLPEPERGGRGRREDRMLGAPTVLARPAASFELEFEAELYISVEGRHPLHFQFEAEIGTESLREMERRESTMTISSMQEGKLVYTVNITPVSADDEE